MVNQNIDSKVDIEAEEAVLGAIIYDNKSLYEVKSVINPDSFFKLEHKKIYKAMLELNEEGAPIDELLVGDQLKLSGDLGGNLTYGFLGNLLNCVPSSGNVYRYARIIRKHEVARRFRFSLSDLQKKLSDPSYKIEDLIGEMEKTILTLQVNDPSKDFISISEVFQKNLNTLEKRSAEEDFMSGLKTGFNELDKKTNGLEDGKLIVTAGRPSMGKTAFALNLGVNKFKFNPKKKGAVLIFSQEMMDEEIGERFLASENTGSVTGTQIRNGSLQTQGEWDSIAEVIGEVGSYPIEIHDSFGITISEIKACCKRYQTIKDHGVDMIIVDYIQLVKSSLSGNKAIREQQVSEITRELKILAGELNCPVIALSQLNRNLESRPNKRPIMADLRESGGIEQDADMILFLYRDDVYYDDSPDKGLAEIIIGKQRNGETGTVKLRYIGKHLKFKNYNGV